MAVSDPSLGVPYPGSQGVSCFAGVGERVASLPVSWDMREQISGQGFLSGTLHICLLVTLDSIPLFGEMDI